MIEHDPKTIPDEKAVAYGLKLRRIREEHGWSRERLAVFIGRSTTCLIWWEAGRTTPRMDDLQKLAATIGVPLADVLPN